MYSESGLKHLQYIHTILCSGGKSALAVLLNGLQRLEYRGYDSAGVAVVDTVDGRAKLTVVKKKGKVANLKAACESTMGHGIEDLSAAGASGGNGPLTGHVGIAHTRWATHGAPNDVNAHPHVSSGGRIAIVHNGIIENYAALKIMLQDTG